MKLGNLWALLGSALLLGACASPPAELPVTRLVTPEAAQSAASPLHSNFHFEAEKAAMSQGCMGPNKIRPLSRVIRQQGSLEWFEVICADRVQRVRCDIGMCVPIR
jgi:hypothetical protein